MARGDCREEDPAREEERVRRQQRRGRSARTVRGSSGLLRRRLRLHASGETMVALGLIHGDSADTGASVGCAPRVPFIVGDACIKFENVVSYVQAV
jgi:hypothetical protein